MVDLGLQVCQVVENFCRHVKFVVTSTVSDTNRIPGKAISCQCFRTSQVFGSRGTIYVETLSKALVLGWF